LQCKLDFEINTNCKPISKEKGKKMPFSEQIYIKYFREKI